MNICRVIGHRWERGRTECYAECRRCHTCPHYCHGGDVDPWHVRLFWDIADWFRR